jgi:hypothetical protein
MRPQVNYVVQRKDNIMAIGLLLLVLLVLAAGGAIFWNWISKD